MIGAVEFFITILGLFAAIATLHKELLGARLINSLERYSDSKKENSYNIHDLVASYIKISLGSLFGRSIFSIKGIRNSAAITTLTFLLVYSIEFVKIGEDPLYFKKWWFTFDYKFPILSILLCTFLTDYISICFTLMLVRFCSKAESLFEIFILFVIDMIITVYIFSWIIAVPFVYVMVTTDFDKTEIAFEMTPSMGAFDATVLLPDGKEKYVGMGLPVSLEPSDGFSTAQFDKAVQEMLNSSSIIHILNSNDNEYHILIDLKGMINSEIKNYYYRAFGLSGTAIEQFLSVISIDPLTNISFELPYENALEPRNLSRVRGLIHYCDGKITPQPPSDPCKLSLSISQQKLVELALRAKAVKFEPLKISLPLLCMPSLIFTFSYYISMIFFILFALTHKYCFSGKEISSDTKIQRSIVVAGIIVGIFGACAKYWLTA